MKKIVWCMGLFLLATLNGLLGVLYANHHPVLFILWVMATAIIYGITSPFSK